MGSEVAFNKNFPRVFFLRPCLPPISSSRRRTQILTLPDPNHPRSPGSQLSIPLSTTRVDKAEHSTYKSLGKVLKKLCNGRHADARGHSPEPAGRRVPWRTPHPVRPETPSRPPSVPPPPEGWPRSGCSPSRLCLRRSSSRSFVAARAGARGWGEGALARLLPSPGRSSELAAGLEPGGAVGSRGEWGPPRGRASPGVGTGPRRWRRGGGRG